MAYEYWGGMNKTKKPIVHIQTVDTSTLFPNQ